MGEVNGLTIMGCGHVGRLLVRLASEHWRVTAVRRNEQSLPKLDHDSVQVLDLDMDINASSWLSEHPDRYYIYTIPPPSSGEQDPRMARFVAALPKKPGIRVVYISTTAVYGDCDGAWIDETRETRPQSERGERRLDAETSLKKWAAQQSGSYVILRVGGIYGPGKLPLERLRKGLPVLAESESPYVNRIHIRDLAGVCLAALRSPPNEIYHVSDGKPGTMTDYFNQVADRLGLPRPPQVPWSEAGEKLTPALLSYLRESRRLDSRKMLRRLGVTLVYPDLQSGLEDIDNHLKKQ